MYVSKFKAALLTAVLAIGASSAQATVITFDNTTSKITPVVKYSEGGYNFLTVGSFFADSTYSGGASGYGTSAYDGTDYLVTAGSLTMTSASKTPFSVTSFDLVNWTSFAWSTVTLTGTRANGTWANLVLPVTYIVNSLNFTQKNDFATYSLAGFDNLTSFSMTNTGGFNAAIDNINVTAFATVPPVSAVPEPSTWAMLGMGLALLGFTARRKKSA